jgi:hypothetical protein
LYAQLLVWIAILGSFGTAVASATELCPPLIIALCAAIPGTVIVIDKTLSFASRARLYHWMRAEVECLKNGLQFQDVTTKDTVTAYNAIIREMTQRFPSVSTSGLVTPLEQEVHPITPPHGPIS